MGRSIYLLFGAVAYLIFFATFLYLIAFVGGLPWVSRHYRLWRRFEPIWRCSIVGLALIALFGIRPEANAYTLRRWRISLPGLK